MSHDFPPSERSTPEALAWIGPLLCAGDPDALVVNGDAPPEGYRISDRYLTVPRASDPYLLVPLSSRAAAGGSVRQVGNPLKGSYRLAERAFGLMLRSGIPQAALRNNQVSVCVPVGATDRPSLADTLARLLGVLDVEVAIVLGRERPNRKPVMRVMDRTGRPLAFVKVGWNDISRRLVRHEVEVLRGTSELPMPSSFRTPRLLGTGSIGDLDLIYVEPAPAGPSHRPPLQAPLKATREVASLEGLSVAGLRDVPCWSRLQQRVEALAGDDATLNLHRRTLASLDERYGERVIPFGRWHGDWTPWNMVMRPDRMLWVWDWERSESGVPLGMDLAHFDFEVRVKVRGEAPTAAAIRSIRSIAPDLERIGLPSGSAHLIASLHLLEMSLRFREADALGHRVRDDQYAEALEAIHRPGMHAVA